MPRSRKLLALVRSRADRQPLLERVASAANYDLELTETIPLASASLRKAPPAVLLLEMNARGAEELCQKARLGRVPDEMCVLVSAHKLNDVAFAKAFQWGADDLVSCEAERSLIQRLARLPEEPLLPQRERGLAVVADPDPLRAVRFGRVLGYAGYAVEVASELDPALQLAFSDAARLVVISAEFGKPAELVTLAREAGSQACFIGVVKPAEAAAIERSLRGLERVGVVADAEPPEAALFVSNEILGYRNDHQRVESRLLYGTVVAFRAAGGDEDDFGFTYNVSPHGLYVRTLAPPDEDQVWLELRPPANQRRVRLAANVAWRRGFGGSSTATAPPGFGVRIAAGLCADHTIWIEGYDVLLAQVEAAARFQPAAASPAAPSEPEIVRSTRVISVPPSTAAVPLPASAEPAAAPPSSAAEPPPERALVAPMTSPEEDRGPSVSTPPAAPESLPDQPSAPPSEERPSAARPPQPKGAAPSRAAWLMLPGFLLGSVAVAGFAYVSGWFGAGTPPRAEPALPRPTPSPVASAALPIPTPTVSIEPEPARSLVVPSAAATASVAPSSAPLPSADGSALPFNRGYLWVRSEMGATVFVNGIAAGSTNALLDVPCGWRFVRLGSTPGPRWLSAGHTVDVVCRGFTRATIDQ